MFMIEFVDDRTGNADAADYRYQVQIDQPDSPANPSILNQLLIRSYPGMIVSPGTDFDVSKENETGLRNSKFFIKFACARLALGLGLGFLGRFQLHFSTALSNVQKILPELGTIWEQNTIEHRLRQNRDARTSQKNERQRR